MVKYLLFIIFFLLSFNGVSHSRDSLISVWNDHKKPDTSRAEAMQYYAWSYLFTSPDTALIWAQEELKFSKEKNLPKWEAKSYNTIGLAYMYMSVLDSAYNYLHHSLDKRIELGNENDIARSYSNIGILHQYLSNYPAAIEYFMKSLEIKERLKDSLGIANTCNNIGTLYSKIKDYENENKYHQKSLSIYTALKNNQGIARVSNNLGVVQIYLKDFKRAHRYFLLSKNLYDKLDDSNGSANVLKGLGNLYLEKEFCEQEGILSFPPEKALEYFLESKEIFLKSNHLVGLANTELNIGQYYKLKGDNKKAIHHCLNSLEIAQENELVNESMQAYGTLFELYKLLGHHEKALEAYIKMDQINDSLFGLKNKNEVLRNEIKLNFESKAIADSIKSAKEKKILDTQLMVKEEQIEKEKLQRTLLYGGIIILFLFLFMTYRRYRISNKRKKIIQKQKEEVEEAHQEIRDSINYAKRLQDAILPSIKNVHQQFPSSFILFKPKDIVSGDFYWMENTQTHTFLAAADCTGHGVPGAMVSVVCANALNKSVNELGKTDPADILNATREFVIATFAKAGSDVKDGMDISLVAFNKPSEGSEPSEGLLKVSYAGANNPLWIIRKDANEVEEIKADKQPIGLYGDLKPFTSHEVKLNKEDVIYMFSDGYPDQFGGAKGKKLKSGSFKKMLLKCRDEDMELQKEILNRTFEEWKGNLEQVDDVCVIGVRL